MQFGWNFARLSCDISARAIERERAHLFGLEKGFKFGRPVGRRPADRDKLLADVKSGQSWPTLVGEEEAKAHVEQECALGRSAIARRCASMLGRPIQVELLKQAGALAYSRLANMLPAREEL